MNSSDFSRETSDDLLISLVTVGRKKDAFVATQAGGFRGLGGASHPLKLDGFGGLRMSFRVSSFTFMYSLSS